MKSKYHPNLALQIFNHGGFWQPKSNIIVGIKKKLKTCGCEAKYTVTIYLWTQFLAQKSLQSVGAGSLNLSKQRAVIGSNCSTWCSHLLPHWHLYGFYLCLSRNSFYEPSHTCSLYLNVILQPIFNRLLCLWWVFFIILLL